jgi:hypothetical protein
MSAMLWKIKITTKYYENFTKSIKVKNLSPEVRLIMLIVGSAVMFSN